MSVSVVEAVERDVALIAKRDEALAESALAAAALTLAAELDDSTNSATSKSMCARALVETMDRLRELAPPAEKKDAVDELRDRRTARRAGRSTA